MSHVEPMDEDALLHPTPEDAATYLGPLLHFVTSAPDLLARFCAFMEHCPGDIPPEFGLRVLAAVHDVASPDCADKITMPGPVVVERCPVHLEPVGDGRVCIACDGGVF